MRAGKFGIISSSLGLALVRGAIAGHYDGPPVDINFNQGKPSKYAECDRFLGDTNARRYASCEFGRDEAERMAARYGAGHGRVQGYLRGFSWALYKSSRTFSNDASAMNDGAKAVAGMGSSMSAGLEAGRSKGISSGRSRGNSDAISRFEAVINSGREPSPELKVPDTQYSGEENAYERYVGKVPTVDEILRRDDVGVGQLPVYSQIDALYLSDVRPVSLYDLYFSDGIYRFEQVRYTDQKLAWDVWLNRPIDTRPKYDSLNQDAPIDPATGQPIDLKAIFQEAFKNSYGWYVNYYFAKEFQESLEEGSLFGEQVGTQVGKRVATARGTQKEFNRVFKESSASTYRNAFVDGYTQSFQNTFADYSSNPKLSLSLESVIGQDPDGILQPGEVFSTEFVVRNMGGKGTALVASVSGTLTSYGTQSFQIGRLESKRFTTAPMGVIDPKLKPRQTAQIQLTVNGLSDGLGQKVQRMIEIRSTKPQLSVVEGSGAVRVVLENVAEVRTPGLIRAALRVGGVLVEEQNVGFAEAGEARDVVFQLSGLDPLKLIEGSVEAKVVVTMEGRVLDESESVLRSSNPRRDLALYFNEVVNGRGVIPDGMNQEVRRSELVQLILSENEAETNRLGERRETNLWKKSPSDTWVGILVNQYQASVQSEEALLAYENLAYGLWSARTHLARFIFKGAKRRAYENLCEELVRDGKISRKDVN